VIKNQRNICETVHKKEKNSERHRRLTGASI
jgi:hypothetical protein